MRYPAHIVKQTIMRSRIYKVILVAGIFCTTTIAMAQGRKMIVGLEANILTGGDGFGMYLEPALNIGYNRISVAGGPLIQRNDMNLSGFQIKPVYSLCDSGYRKMFVYVFAQSVYNRQVYLSDTYDMILKKLEPEMVGKERIHFRTFQQYVGIGIAGDNTKRISPKAEIGVGGYLDLGSKAESPVPASFQGTRSNSDISLMFSLGVRLNLIKQVK